MRNDGELCPALGSKRRFSNQSAKSSPPHQNVNEARLPRRPAHALPVTSLASARSAETGSEGIAGRGDRETSLFSCAGDQAKKGGTANWHRSLGPRGRPWWWRHTFGWDPRSFREEARSSTGSARGQRRYFVLHSKGIQGGCGVECR